MRFLRALAGASVRTSLSSGGTASPRSSGRMTRYARMSAIGTAGGGRATVVISHHAPSHKRLKGQRTRHPPEGHLLAFIDVDEGWPSAQSLQCRASNETMYLTLQRGYAA